MAYFNQTAYLTRASLVSDYPFSFAGVAMIIEAGAFSSHRISHTNSASTESHALGWLQDTPATAGDVTVDAIDIGNGAEVPHHGQHGLFYAGASRHGSATSRNAAAHGIGSATNTASSAYTATDTTSIGATIISSGTTIWEPWELYDVAMWDVDIGIDVATMIAAGQHPYTAHPRGMVSFVPFDSPGPFDVLAHGWTQAGSGRLRAGVQTNQRPRRPPAWPVTARTRCARQIMARRKVAR